MLLKRHFHLGLNTDDEDKLLQDGEYRFALNIRSGSSDDSDTGAITNVKGNTLVTFLLPDGTNKVIGAKEDPGQKRIIYFLFNSANQHQILQYSYLTKSVTKILQDPSLNFQIDKFIFHIDVIDGKLLYFTDNFNGPRKTNIERLILQPSDPNAYPVPFKEQYINAIQEPPLCPPEVEYRTDASKKSNNLKEKLFQVKYQYQYPDGEISVWSPISKVALPIGEEYEEQVTFLPVFENNVIKVTLEPGDRDVEKIRVAVRIGNLGDFFLVTTLDRSDFGTGPFVYDFFNDGIYSTIEINESNRSFDRVPYQAQAQSLIDGNKLTYTNFVEGRDAVDIDVSITPVYSDKTINTALSQFTLQVISSKKVRYTVTNAASLSTPMEDDNIFNVTVSIANDLGTFQYLVNSEDDDTSEDIVDRFVAQINSDDNNTFFTAFKVSATQFQVDSLDKLISSGIRVDTITRTQRGLKRGAFHEFAIVYYDFALRSGAVNTDDTARVYINFYPDTPGGEGVASVDIQINHIPPIWAFKYQILYTQNQTVASFIQFTTNKVTSPGNTIVLDLQPITFYSDAHPNSILVYSFTKGDRIRFIRKGTGFPYNSLVDVEVLSFDQAANEIKISDKINILISAGTVFEIYTPQKSISSKIYREIGECFDVLEPGTDNRRHQGNFQDQLPAGTVVPSTTITGDVSGFTVVSNTLSLFSLTNNFITDLIDSAQVSVGDSITLSGAGAYNGTHIVEKIRSVTTSNVANSYIRLATGNLGPAPSGSLFNPGPLITMTLIIPSTPGATSAIVKLVNQGDVYYKARVMVTSPNVVKTFLVEDFNYSDFYDSAVINIGRPNVEDENFQEIRRFATTFVSEVFIPDTNVNGLSSFYGFSFPDTPARAKDWDKSWGSVQKTYAEDKRLILFQELKVGSALINESVIFDQEGVPTINKSNEILSDIIYYVGEWGIGKQPGSFVVYGNRKYFADMRRGAVLRLSQNGITEISENQMHNYFTDTFKASIQAFETPRMFAVYDKKFSEYVLSIELAVEETVIVGQAHKIEGSTHDVPFTGLGIVHNFIHGIFRSGGITLIDVGADNIGSFTGVEFVEVTYTDAISGLEVIQLVPIFGTVGNDIQVRLIRQDALNDGDSVTVKFGRKIITSEDIIGTFGEPFPGTFVIGFIPPDDFALMQDLGLVTLEISFFNTTTNQQATAIFGGVSFQGPNNIFLDVPTGITIGNLVQVQIINTKLSSTTIERFDTIAFNDSNDQQRWKTFYSYEPEMMVSSDTDIITFKQGQLYRHNENSIRNNFYGEQFTSIVELIFNADFSTRKFWLSLTEEASKIWEAIRITNQNGQKTNLVEADFEDIEGDFYAEILQDENTPVVNPIIEGDDMRSHELTVRLENKDTGNVKMIMAGVEVKASERTNK